MATELADALYDDSIEVVGTVGPGLPQYYIRVRPRNFADLPENPHPNDREFNTTAPPAGWRLFDSASANATYVETVFGIPVDEDVDLFNAPSDPLTFAFHRQRRSWMLVQPQAVSNKFYFYGFKTTRPEAFTLRSRLYTVTRSSGVASNAASILLAMFADAGDAPSGNNRIMVGYEADADMLFEAQMVSGGVVNAQVGTPFNSLQGPGRDVEAVLACNGATGYPGWNTNSQGHFIHRSGGNGSWPLPASLGSGQTVWLGFMFYSHNEGIVGYQSYMGADYYRQTDSMLKVY